MQNESDQPAPHSHLWSNLNRGRTEGRMCGMRWDGGNESVAREVLRKRGKGKQRAISYVRRG